MTALAKIHVLKKQAGLDDESYRDLLERETGLRSSADMTDDQHLKVIGALDRLVPGTETPNRATGKFAKKLQALWIAGYNLGVIRNRSDKAMIAFLRRQTGLDHTRFLRDPKDADKAIDALKLWMRRATGNDGLFRKDRSLPPLWNDFRFQITMHAWTELVAAGAAPAPTLTTYLTFAFGKVDPATLTQQEWIDLQNGLGKLLRGLR